MKRIQALVKKELWESRIRLLVCVLIMTAIAVSLPMLFDWARNIFQEMESAEGWAGTVTAQMSDYRLYLWSNWWGKNHSQTMIVIALVWGMGIVARERENGVLSYLLTRPVARAELLAVKFAVGVLSLAMISLGSTLALIVASVLARSGETPWFILRAWPQAIMVTLAVFSLTMLFSTLIRDRIMALLASLGTTALFTGLGFLRPFRQINPLVLMSAPRALVTGRQDVTVLAALILVIAGLYALAHTTLRRMEL